MNILGKYTVLIRSQLFFFIQLLFLGVVSGCASLPFVTIDESDHRNIEFAQIGRASPVVVFENGLGASMDSWSEVFTEVGKDTTVFAYNRPGYGRSSSGTTARDGITIVEELRTFLLHRDLRPPYILVGHSLGGLYMQIFARKYPAEVAGLVLVDSSHPTQFQGPGAMENWPIWAKFLWVFLNESQDQELLAAEQTGEQVMGLPALTNKPVTILSVKEKSESEMAIFINEKRADLANLYPNSTQIWVDSGHFIQKEKPEVVIEAIRDIATYPLPPE